MWHGGCLPFKKNPGQFGWKIANGKNCLPLTKNSDYGKRVPFLHTEHLSGAWSWELKSLITWNWCEKRGTCKWNKEIHSKRSNRENRTTFSDNPYISGVFQLDETKKRFHLHSNRNWNFLANGKQPVFVDMRLLLNVSLARVVFHKSWSLIVASLAKTWTGKRLQGAMNKRCVYKHSTALAQLPYMRITNNTDGHSTA